MLMLKGGGCIRAMRVLVPRALSLSLFLAATIPVRSHESIEIQVTALTRELAGDPENAALLLQRGELHRVHRDWPAALADYRRAIEIDPGLHVVNLCAGQLFLEAGLPSLALVALDRFLSTTPDHAEAHLLRARAFLDLERRLAAAVEFTHGIDLKWRQRGARGPRPDDYLDRARALVSEGGEHVDEAIRGLDEGASKLGGAIALQLLAMDLEVSRRRWDAALERLQAIEARSPRKERWLVRRGEVLLEAGRVREARRAFEAALETIEALPDHCRRTQAMAALAARIGDALSARCPAEDIGPQEMTFTPENEVNR